MPKKDARRVRKLAGYLRKARQAKGVSIKKAAPELGVDYTHLSKIENGVASPSAALLARLILLYEVENPDVIYGAAGILPPDIDRILSGRPSAAYALLRSRLGES
jgi:transcriptional regulator with XRE-family HTH domain